jgi:hypothetical protein
MADYIFERPDGHEGSSSIWKNKLISLPNDYHKTKIPKKKYVYDYKRKLQLKMEEK